MSRIFSVLLLLTIGVVGCSEVSSPDDGGQGPLERGRTYTRWFHSGEVNAIWDRLSPELREAFGGIEGLRQFGEQVRAGFGLERAVQEETVIPWLGASIYHRTSTFADFAAPVWTQWTIDPAGGVLAFLVQPAQAPAPSEHLDHTTEASLRLPFTGTWFVYWGGRTVQENYHAASPDQRFAYDLAVVQEERTHAGDPARNESYHCFGLPVLAPASGMVVAAEDGIADNPPGVMNEQQVLGNHVVIDHGTGEFSFLAHLHDGSVAVAAGQQVNAGDVIGRCGNSGRSSEPHLHYHLQTTPRFAEGDGLPAQFLDYVADGEPIARGEPARGQSISPAETTAR